jgi:anti-anti-sigma factor
MDGVKQIRVALQGEYDIARRDELRETLASIEGPATIDLSEVTFGDSTFLQELVRVKRRLDSDGGGALVLAGANLNIRRILKIAGFEKLFEVVD